MRSSRLSIVLRGARSRRRRRSLRSSCKRGAHGIRAPAMLPSTAITFGGRSATPVAERRTRSLLTKNPRMVIKRITGATQSFRTRQRLSTSSSREMRIFVPGGIRSCSSGRFCPSSRRYHDHSVGRRSPSRSLVMTSGRDFPSPTSSPWSWILWWRTSSLPRSSSMAGAGSISSSSAL
jgi:hypothetical protein